ncbi:50S ribosomal protein L11 methyltransferase [Brevibacillus ginsengisoli]|uniref:50S ribosomal protein L11 methyltransferase n=1 Tax=Brevibacillus ginsengisoli TaxID=363854 RepID=UPI003CFB8895
MASMWLKYTLVLSEEVEEIFTASLLESNYTLGWTEPQIEVIVTDNGYDFAQQQEKPLIGYVFEPLHDSVEQAVKQFRDYLSRWENQVSLMAHELVEEENESWKDEFQPVTVGEWAIAPSWTPAEELPDSSHIMWIDPGAAFGTGYHVTTQDMITYLQKINLNNQQVLDIGAGSGILSLFCVKLGAATPVVAVDINPESDWQINQNLTLNQLPGEAVEVIITDPLAQDSTPLPKEMDLVMVNIGGDEDITMLPVVRNSLRIGGTAILSGIVTWNKEKVIQAYADGGFELVQETTSNEWVTLVTKLCENKE